MAVSAHVNGQKAVVRKDAVYSPVQTSRLHHTPTFPTVLQGAFKLNHGPPSTAAGHPDEIQKLFPCLYGQSSVELVRSAVSSYNVDQTLKVGVVLSDGQAPGGHNVIAGFFDYILTHSPGSVLYGFKGGPAGIMRKNVVEITANFLYPYRNQGGFDIICSGRDKIETPDQFQQAVATVTALDLDGLVVIGGDDSNPNAALLGREPDHYVGIFWMTLNGMILEISCQDFFCKTFRQSQLSGLLTLAGLVEGSSGLSAIHKFLGYMHVNTVRLLSSLFSVGTWSNPAVRIETNSIWQGLWFALLLSTPMHSIPSCQRRLR